MKRNILFIILLSAFSISSFAQKIPPGIGIGVGYNDFELGGVDATGAMVHAKFAYTFDTFPIFFAIARANYGELKIEADGSDEDADILTLGAGLGMMIPFDSNGLGLPIYLTYNQEKIGFENADDINGTGYTFGTQLPVPIFPQNGKIHLGFQVEYSEADFDGEEVPSFLSGNDLEREGMTYFLNLSILL